MCDGYGTWRRSRSRARRREASALVRPVLVRLHRRRRLEDRGDRGVARGGPRVASPPLEPVAPVAAGRGVDSRRVAQTRGARITFELTYALTPTRSRPAAST